MPAERAASSPVGRSDLAGRAMNAGLPVLVWLIPLAVSFYTTPGLVSAFGTSNYGNYALALGIAAFAAVPSANTAVARFSRALPGQRATAPFLAISGTLAVFIVANVLIVALPVALTHTSKWSPAPAVIGMLLAAISLLIIGASFSQLLMARLQMRYRWPLGAGVVIVTGCGSSLAALMAAKSGASWPWAITLQSGVAVAGLGLLLAIDRYLGDLPRKPAGEYSSFGPVFAFMTRTAASGLIGSLLIVGERVFLSARFGSVSTGYYALAMSIALLLHAVISSASVRLPLHFSSVRDATDAGHFPSAYERAVRLTIYAAAGGLALLLLRGDSLSILWLGPEVGTPVGTFLPFLAAAMAAFAMIIPTWIALEITGRERRNVVLMISVAACVLAGAVLLAGALGPLSLAYGRLAGVPVVALYVFLGERALFGRPRVGIWLNTIARSLTAAVPIVFLDAVMPDDTIVHLIMFGMFAAISYLALGGLLGLWRKSDLGALQGVPDTNADGHHSTL